MSSSDIARRGDPCRSIYVRRSATMSRRVISGRASNVRRRWMTFWWSVLLQSHPPGGQGCQIRSACWRLRDGRQRMRRRAVTQIGVSGMPLDCAYGRLGGLGYHERAKHASRLIHESRSAYARLRNARGRGGGHRRMPGRRFTTRWTRGGRTRGGTQALHPRCYGIHRTPGIFAGTRSRRAAT